MSKRSAPLHTSLLLAFILIVIVPLCLLGLIFLGLDGSVPDWQTKFILWIVSLLLLGVLYIFYTIRLLKRRLVMPLKQFNSSLEGISEGFLMDEIPEGIFQKAEPGITEAFRKVIQINKMMLKNVDHLEKGFEEERSAKLQQIALTKAYERFVPHEFLSFLHKESIVQVQHGDHVQTEMSIMFSDIRSFTALSERISAEDNFKLLNSYLMLMEPVVQKNGGFIDKFIGDAIMALFHQGADSAIRAAIGMVCELKAFNEDQLNKGLETISIGIGINTVSMMLGIIGGKNRMESTVISDAVNVAARIEDLNKAYGTSVLISEYAYQALIRPDSFHIRLIDKVSVKGKSKPLHIYEVYDADEPMLRKQKLAFHQQFEQGFNHYHLQQANEAYAYFAEIFRECPGDQVAAIYLDRCNEIMNLKRGDQENEAAED
jgi:class 3 adenylate cyclase